MCVRIFLCVAPHRPNNKKVPYFSRLLRVVLLERLRLLLQLLLLGHDRRHVPLQPGQDPADRLLGLDVKGLHAKCGVEVVTLSVHNVAQVVPLVVELAEALLDLLVGGQVGVVAVDGIFDVGGAVELLGGGAELLVLQTLRGDQLAR